MAARANVVRPEALALALMFAVGALLALVVPFVPHGREIDTVGWLVNGSLAFPVAAVLLVVPHRIPAAAYHVVLLVGGVVVANGIWFGNGGSASIAASFFYIWVPLYAFWAWDWRTATLHVVADALLLAIALDAADVPGAVAVWLIIVGTAAVAGFVVGFMRREVSALAAVDALTQLPNRHSLHETLQREVVRLRRHPDPLALAIIDVDDLKTVNDRDGHRAGDELLRTAARQWRSALRETDVLVRYGGDEFIVVMPRTTAAEAREVLDRLAARSTARFSAGVVEWLPGDEPDTLIERADTLLYAGKRAGGRRITGGLAPPFPSIA